MFGRFQQGHPRGRQQQVLQHNLGTISNVATLKVGNSTFSNNRTVLCCTSGGAILNSGEAIVTNSTFTGNTADPAGRTEMASPLTKPARLLRAREQLGVKPELTRR